MNLEQFFSHDAVVPMKKLTDITTTEDTTKLTLDLTNNTWGDHGFVLLRFTPSPNAVNGTSGFVTINNQDTSAYHATLPNSKYTVSDPRLLSADYNKTFMLLFFIGANGNELFAGLALYDGLLYHFRSNQVRTKNIESLEIGGTGATLYSGTRIEIWGVM